MEFAPYDDTELDVKFDLCLVFDTYEDGDISEESQAVLDRIVMAVGRKYVHQFISDYGEKFVLIRASITKLKSIAERRGIRLLVSPNECLSLLSRGNTDVGISPIFLTENSDITPLDPHDYIYIKYKSSVDDLFWRSAGQSHPFTPRIKLQLLLDWIAEPQWKGGAGISLRDEVNAGSISSYFPLHQYSLKKKISERWKLSLRYWDQPVNMIRNYFGDRIGIYVCFSAHLLEWYLLPLLLGVAFQIVSIYFDDRSRYETIIFGYVVGLWAILVAKSWSNKERLQGVYWGDYWAQFACVPRVEQRRPAYRGFRLPSHIDGSDDLHSSIDLQRCLNLISNSIMGLCVMFVLGCVCGAFYVRHILHGIAGVSPYAQWICAGLLAIQVNGLGLVFRYIVRGIVSFENHKTDRSMENSYAVKIFVLNLVNTFTSFYYIAFGAPYLGSASETFVGKISGCHYSDCMTDISINMIVIFGLRITIAFYFKFVFPVLLHRPEEVLRGRVWQQKQREAMAEASKHEDRESGFEMPSPTRGRPSPHRDLELQDLYEPAAEPAEFPQEWSEGKDVSPPRPSAQRFEKKSISRLGLSETEGVAQTKVLDMPPVLPAETDRQYCQSYYTVSLDWSDEMNERIQDLLMVSLFSTALPAAFLAAFLSNVLTSCGFSWRMLFQHRRPLPNDTPEIGRVWKNILSFCVILTILTNSALTAFVVEVFHKWSTENKLLFFIAFHGSLLSVYGYLCIVNPSDVDNEVKSTQRLRAAFIESKLINLEPDFFVQSPISIL